MPRIPQDSTYQETFIGKDNLTEDENDSNDGIPKYLIVLKGFFFIYLRGKLRGATRDHFPYK